MYQEGEVKYCNISKDIFLKHIEHNYRFIKEKLPLLEKLDPDAIHDIRVTSRRNRALFTEYKHFLPKEIKKEYIRENKIITRLLGKRRELDVLYQLIISIKNDTPQVLSDFAYDYLLTSLDKIRKIEEKNCFLAKQILDKRGDKFYPDFQTQFYESYCIYKYGRERILLAISNINNEYKYVKEINNPLNEEVHQFRIIIKKTRYMFEIYKEIYKNPLNKWLNIIKEIQNFLGNWNDYRILLITIKKLEKKRVRFEELKNYIYDILIINLEKAKLTVEENIKSDFVKTTRKDINKICKSHACLL